MISSRFLLFSLCGSAGLSGVSSDWKGGAGREEESLGCVRRRLSQETSFEAGLQGCRAAGWRAEVTTAQTSRSGGF